MKTVLSQLQQQHQQHHFVRHKMSLCRADMDDDDMRDTKPHLHLLLLQNLPHFTK